MATEEMSGKELLAALVGYGKDLIRRINRQQASLGELQQDTRWKGPLPLTFEVQVQVHLLAAMDASYGVLSLLEERASQQVFGMLRFQIEGLALLRWLTEPADPRDRQGRAYQVLLGQHRRMVDFHKGDRDSPPTGLTQDAGSEPEDDWTPDKAVEAAGGQFAKLQQLAIEDGFDPFDPREEPPARKDLFGTYFPEGSHASFHMYSEMGSHPPGNGNVLFAFDPETGATSFDLEAHEEARAWWASVSIRLLCKAGDRVGRALGWEEWIDRELVPWAQEFAPLQEEALRRRQAVP